MGGRKKGGNPTVQEEVKRKRPIKFFSVYESYRGLGGKRKTIGRPGASHLVWGPGEVKEKGFSL